MNDKQIELINKCFDFIQENSNEGCTNSAEVARHVLEMSRYDVSEKIINAFLNAIE